MIPLLIGPPTRTCFCGGAQTQQIDVFFRFQPTSTGCRPTRLGRLLIQGALACGTEAEPVKLAMIDWRKSGEAALKKRLQQAQSEGELPAEIQPGAFARYLSLVMAGLGVQAANGATRTESRRVAEISLRCIEAALWAPANG